MKKAIATTIAFFFGLGCFAQGDKLFRVELRLPKTEYVLGEPVWCSEVFFHAPLIPSGAMEWEAVHVKGPVRAACHAEKRLVEQGMRIGKPEPGPPEFTRTFLLSDCGIVDAGEYELWTEYPADLYFDRTYAPTPTAPPVSSNHIRVKIVAPAGMDAEVFAAHHERCNKITLSPQELLDNFPTSTYAGYALVGHGDGSTLWYIAAMTPEQREIHWSIPKGASQQAQDAHRAKARQGCEEFVAMAERFLAVHPDFAQADLLHKELANSLFLLDRRDAALIHVRALAESKSAVSEEAKKTLEVLKQKDGG